MAAIMRRTTSFALVLWLVFAAEMGQGWVEDVKDNLNEFSENAKLDEKAEAVKQGASDAFDHVKDKTETWSNWAYDKISQGFGKNEDVKETAHYVVDKAGDAAIKTTQKINTAASGASNYASEKTEEAKNTAAEAAKDLKSKSENVAEAASEKAGDMKVKARETLEEGKDKAAEAAMNLKSKSENVVGAAAEKAGDMKVKGRETLESGKDKAAEAYETAKNGVEEKVAEAKDNGESAKEMASKAAGDIGARMREKTAEL